MTLPSKEYNFNLANLGLENVNVREFEAPQGEAQEAARFSYLGTPVYTSLVIPSGQYIDNEGQTIAFEGVRIDTVLMDVSLEKNIVRTPINGRNGTVKQFIGLGDYAVNVQAIINGTSSEVSGGFTVENTNQIPEEEIRKLNAILQVPQEIEIISEFLDFFDISTVVIEGGNIAQREGYFDSFILSMGLLSDTPVELREDR